MISRDEWRSWIDEKHRLVTIHNQEKAELMQELRALRLALNPQTEQIMIDLRRSDSLRKSMEEDIQKSENQVRQLNVSDG